ncbi:paired amphipathic helix [Crepidotus variabilis]|uniref:Paired amphipathic helix n=1 Tax=Crepidotus variabilis TaxID=179855 RepID=A0A9P6EF13_9AGAR|nr:paired amphipathic helix [Crepidotus variabilis]
MQAPQAPQTFAAPGSAQQVTDALGYLDTLKAKFSDRPDIYSQFLDIMGDFKNAHQLIAIKSIDTSEVIRRVIDLFNGDPVLIQGFNVFLPPGYQITCSTNLQGVDTITVTTPTGTTTQLA